MKKQFKKPINIVLLFVVLFEVLFLTANVYADLTGTEGLAIDLSSAGAGTDFTIAFDPTEFLGSRTWGDASTDTIVWTWNRSTGTDPTITFNSGSIALPALTLTTDLAVAEGGTGASTLGDGFVLLGNAAGAIQALDVTTDGGIIIGDGTTDPVVLDVGSSTAITILGTVATGVWQGTAVADGYIPNDITIDLAAAVTNATLTTALTVNTGTLTLTANAANNSVLTIGAGAVSVSGANTGDNAGTDDQTLAEVLAEGADGGDVDQTSLGKLEFFDAGLYIDADADGVMDITSDGTLELHSADWDISTTGVVTDVSISAANNVVEADTVTNATLTTALTVNTGTLTLTADVANNSVLTIGAGASSISGANTGDNTVATTGDSATAFFGEGTIEHERGGLQADVSGYTGLVAITGADTTAEIDSLDELEGQLADVTRIVTEAIMPVAATDPDVDAAGELSIDTDGANEPNDVVLRTSSVSGNQQYALAQVIKSIQGTVIKPNDLADATRDALPIWENNTGMTFVITMIRAWSDTDDTTLNVETYDSAWANNATVDALEIATNGTANFYVEETTITAPNIVAGSLIVLDFDDTDNPGWVKFNIMGYLLSNVD